MSQDERNEETKPKPSDTPDQSRERPKDAPLDPGQLDLTIEEVEERISPSETNVFDK